MTKAFIHQRKKSFINYFYQWKILKLLKFKQIQNMFSNYICLFAIKKTKFQFEEKSVNLFYTKIFCLCSKSACTFDIALSHDTIECSINREFTVIFFLNQNSHFVWDLQLKMFVSLFDLLPDTPCGFSKNSLAKKGF